MPCVPTKVICALAGTENITYLSPAPSFKRYQSIQTPLALSFPSSFNSFTWFAESKVILKEQSRRKQFPGTLNRRSTVPPEGTGGVAYTGTKKASPGYILGRRKVMILPTSFSKESPTTSTSLKKQKKPYCKNVMETSSAVRLSFVYSKVVLRNSLPCALKDPLLCVP